MLVLLKKNKNFRLFWLASSISGIGDYIDDIAFSALVYMVTESTFITGFVFAIKIILSFASMFTSTIVDYGNKKKILIITSWGQAINLFLFLVLYLFGNITVYLLILFITIQTLFSTFSIPAQNAILPLLIEKEDTIVARSFNGMFQHFIQIFSYLGSGVLIAVLGISGAIVIDIITFGIAGLLMLFVGNLDIPSMRMVKDSFKETVVQGFKFIFNNQIIMVVIVVTSIGNFLTAPIDSLSIVYFSEFYDKKLYYSIYMSAIALGGVVGTWYLTKVKNKISTNWLMGIGFMIGGIGITLMILSGYVFFPMISGLLYGISNGIVSVMNSVILQVNTPKEMMGRVFSAFRCISFAAGPLGIITIGYWGEFIKLDKLFFILGIGLTFMAMVCLKKMKSPK